MKSSRILVLAAVSTVLYGCSLVHWSGHPTRITGISGLEPDPARPAAPGKEAKPFIARMPVSYEDYTAAARLYLDLAGKYRQEAASHQEMQRRYEGKDPEMAGHCSGLALQLSDLAARCEEIGRALQIKADHLKPEN